MLVLSSILLLISQSFGVDLKINAANVVDFLETEENYWLLDDFQFLIQVSKKDKTETRYLVCGSGPQQVRSPLSIVNTPDGPVLSGLFGQLRIKEEAKASSFIFQKLPVTGPLVFENEQRRLFGTGTNYWDSDGNGFGAMVVEKNQTKYRILPFENPVGRVHPRCFAAVAQRGSTVLYGAPVDLKVRLYLKEAALELPLDLSCVRKWEGQQPEQFKDPNLFARSWDYFIANGTWILQKESRTYAVTTLTSKCHDAITFVWVVEDGKILKRHTVTWNDERPVSAHLVNGRVRFIVAAFGEDHMRIYEK